MVVTLDRTQAVLFDNNVTMLFADDKNVTMLKSGAELY
jgi:uncharacterized protein YqkB